jgi:hypothetical protein
MPTEDPDFPKLLSVPGLMAIAIFGLSVIVVSRLFGPENILREIVTELLASFGSTILLFAIFGFFQNRPTALASLGTRRGNLRGIRGTP